MIQYLLDTDIVSLLQDRNPNVVSHISGVPAEHIATSIITVEEQLSGWYTLLRRVRRTEQLVPGEHQAVSRSGASRTRVV